MRPLRPHFGQANGKDSNGRLWPIAVIPRGVRLQASNPQLFGRRSLFDHLVGAKQDRWAYRKAKRHGGLEVHGHLELGRKLPREIARLRAEAERRWQGGARTGWSSGLCRPHTLCSRDKSSAKSNAGMSFLTSSFRPRRRRREPACSQKLSVDFVAARTRKVSGRETFRKEGTIWRGFKGSYSK